jgi:hypothetical protein
MSGTHKIYIPAGEWLVASITSYCQTHGIGSADWAPSFWYPQRGSKTSGNKY